MNTLTPVPGCNGLYVMRGALKSTYKVKARQSGVNKIVTVTLGRTDVLKLKEAKLLAKAALAELGQGRNPNSEKKKRQQEEARNERRSQKFQITVGELVSDYLANVTLTPKTRRDTENALRRNFSDWWEMPARDVTREDVLARFKAIKARVIKARKARDQARIASGEEPSRFADSDGSGEAQKAFRYLNSVWNYSKNDIYEGEKLLPDNPINVLADKRIRRVLTPRNDHLDELKVRHLIEEFEIAHHPEYTGSLKQDDIDLTSFYLLCALRLDEACQLQWSDVDWNNKTFTVVNPKNKRDHRLPMTKTIERVLKRRLQAQSDAPTPYVFPSPLDPTKPASASRVFERVSASTGFPVTAHTLRRTFATHASSIGVSYQHIKEALNHKDHDVTASYIQRSTDTLRDTLETVEALLLGGYKVDPNGSDSAAQDTNHATGDWL